MLQSSQTSQSAPYLARLNSEQREAVEHVSGPMLVLAGAGSGKTRVLTTRIAHLIHAHGVQPTRIMAVTFTNKAADEMRDRITSLIGSPPEGMWVGTFHSFGSAFLRRHADRLGWTRRFSIFDGDDSLRLIKRLLKEAHVDPNVLAPRDAQALLSAQKSYLRGPQEFLALAEERRGDAKVERVLAQLYVRYDAELAAQNAFDFDDLLLRPVQILERCHDLRATWQGRYDQILVDEYQDTNPAQLKLLLLLAARRPNLTVVGDEDQAIFGWRQADIQNILGFEDQFPTAKVVRLEQNYRSTGTILDAANTVISNNTQRKGKTLRATKGEGPLIGLAVLEDDREEATWIADEIARTLRANPERTASDFAILYRTNAQSRQIEEALRVARMPYQVVGGVSFYERREIKDLMAYLNLIANPNHDQAFERVVNYPRRGLGRKSLDAVMSHARAHGIPLLQAAMSADEVPGLSTRAKAAFADFAKLILSLRGFAATAEAGAVLERVAARIDLRAALLSEGEEGQSRLENVESLITGAHEFVDIEGLDPEHESMGPSGMTSLDRYLEKVTLVSDVDELDDQAEAVTLMTAHAAKGLEFPVVFLAGLEEGLFPHSRSLGDPSALEEERRLFYVGVTRAEDRLYLARALSRFRMGEVTSAAASAFLKEIPRDLIEPLARQRAPFDARRAGGYGRPTPPQPDPTRPSPGSVLKTFGSGQRVTHPTFGNGTIVATKGEGQAQQVVVAFDGLGLKSLLVRYARLAPEQATRPRSGPAR